MLGDLVVFAAAELAVLTASAFVFSGSDPAEDDQDDGPPEGGAEAAESLSQPPR